MSRELSPMLHTVKQGLAEHFPLACLDTRETYFLHFIPIFCLCRPDKLTELLERVFACIKQLVGGTSVQLLPSGSWTIGYSIRKQQFHGKDVNQQSSYVACIRARKRDLKCLRMRGKPFLPPFRLLLVIKQQFSKRNRRIHWPSLRTARTKNKMTVYRPRVRHT